MAKKFHSGSGRMDAQLERIEIQSTVTCNHNLAVEDATIRQLRQQWLDQLGKIPVQRLLIATLDQEICPIAKD